MSSLYKLLYVLIFLLISSCSSVIHIKKVDQGLIGGSVKNALSTLSLKLDKVPFYTEPPAVVRGLQGVTPNGENVTIFITRDQVPLTFEGGDNLDLYPDLKVIGVYRAIGDVRICTGNVLWHHQHFCEFYSRNK